MEAVGIGLVMPFVSLLGRPHLVDENATLRWVRDAAGVRTHFGMITLAGLVLVATFLVKNVYLAFVDYAQNRFIYSRQIRTSNLLMERYMRRPYWFHLRHNSSELIHNVHTEVSQVYTHVICTMFVIAVEVLSVSVILLLLITLEPLIVPGIGLLVGGVGVVFYKAIHRRAALIGEEQREVQADMLRWLQQGLGGIKEARVLGAEDFFVQAFSARGQRFGKLLAMHRQLSMLPKNILETCGVAALVAVTLLALSRSGDPQRVLPMLGALAVASIRILPSASRILSGVSLMRYCKPSLDGLWAAMEPMPGDGKIGRRRAEVAPLRLMEKIEIADVAVRYPGAASSSLTGVTLEIRRGESIALVGASGAGKTTLADTLIGLLEPESGEIRVDGKALVAGTMEAWQRSIGYIPQTVFLSDDTFRRNIAFGLEDKEIDEARVIAAAKTARLSEHLMSLPDGLDTMVGERGVRLSGGQRQRIGIARALYCDPHVLVLDEATSSLDGATEREIVEAIESLRNERTIIIIAHRLSTVRACDRLVYMAKGKIVDVGTWEQLLARNADFRRMVELARTDQSGVDRSDSEATTDSVQRRNVTHEKEAMK